MSASDTSGSSSGRWVPRRTATRKTDLRGTHETRTRGRPPIVVRDADPVARVEAPCAVEVRGVRRTSETEGDHKTPKYVVLWRDRPGHFDRGNRPRSNVTGSTRSVSPCG